MADVVQGQLPANVDKRTVKQLVQQQIEARKPIRAPWYREGLRSSRSYNTKGMQPPAPQQQHSLASGHLKVRECFQQICELSALVFASSLLCIGTAWGQCELYG